MVKSHPFLTNEWLQAESSYVLLFPLQIWKLPHRIKCSDHFRVNKRDTWGKYKALGQCKYLVCLNLIIDLRFFMVFTERRGEVTESEMDSDVTAAVFNFGREECC